MKRIVGVEYENGKVSGTVIDGLNEDEDCAYFRRCVRAKWVEKTHDDGDGLVYFLFYCSHCNKPSVRQYRFCRHCGAEMDVENEEE